MGYPLAMRVQFLLISFGLIFMFAAAPRLRADEVDMQNGDRYFGKVLSVSAGTVVLESEVLGVINVPRKKVASLAFGTNAVAPKAAADAAPVSVSTNLPAAAPAGAWAGANPDLSAALRDLGANTNFIGQIRRQLLAGNPGAASNYDAMVSSLLNGSLNLDDLRREAQSSADQLREMKRDLGPEAGSSLDAYLEVLDQFLNETASGPTNAVPVSRPKLQAP